MNKIYPLSEIHPDANIGHGVEIAPFVSIHQDVEIGEGTSIGANVTIMNGARIGQNCKIFPGAVISAIPQDLKFGGEYSQLIIGDNTTIRECVTLNRGTNDSKETRIGANCLIMAYVHVAHDCIVGNNCIIANAVQIAGHVQIDDWAIIGGTSAIHQFVSIGKHSMVSGGSLVKKDVPPYAKAGREPLSYIGVNSVGLRRRGIESVKINHIQDIYRVLFIHNHNNTRAMEIIEAKFDPTEERDEIVDFIRNSKRGIMKGYGERGVV